MAGSKKLNGLAAGLLGVCLFITVSGNSSSHPRANFKGTRYEKQVVEHQPLESAPISEVDYVDGPLAPLYEFLIQHRLHRFCKLLRDAGLEQVIRDLGDSWTLFAPTDASFIFLPGGTLEELQRNPQLLSDFILYHFIVGDFPSSQIESEMLVDSVQGSPLRFNIYGETTTVSGAEILQPDLIFEMGRVYIVDRPLYPIPSEDMRTYLQKNHKQIYKLLLDTGLIDYLSSGTFTLLAPDDEAFGYLSVELKDALATNISLAERILLNHILPGSVYVGGITDGMQWETVGGSPITFTVKRGLTFANDIPIVLPDISLTNGVLHVLNRVLLPEGIDADCQCKPSSEGNQRPGHVSGGSRPSSVQPQRPPYGQGRPTTRRPGHISPIQDPQPIGGQTPGTSGQREPQVQPQAPSTSPSQSGNRPWSPSRTGQPGRPAPSPNQGSRSPYPSESPSDEDINSVIGTGVQPDTGPRRPQQTRTTRYPPQPTPRQRLTPRPPQNVGSHTTKKPQGGAYPDSENENYPEQEITQGVSHTTRQTDTWSNRQRTPAPRYPTPQRGSFNTPSTRRPHTTRTYDWNQPRVTQPSLDQPDINSGIDSSTLNQEQGLQTQRPAAHTTSWQQRKQVTQPTRQPIQRTTFQTPRQPPSSQRWTTTPRSSFERTTTSQISPNEQPFEPNRQQQNCRRQGDRITPFTRNLPLCTESIPDGCQSPPYNPSDARPLCPGSDPSDCRNPEDPYDPTDNRPLCPSPVSAEDCREFGQPTYTGDRRPLCSPSSVPQTGCKDPSAPYNPSDRRPVCRATSTTSAIPPSSIPQTGCKDPSAPYNPSDRRPVCRTTSASPIIPPSSQGGSGPPQGCRRPNEVVNPQDRRPLCPDEPEADCRPLLERPMPGDRRPICKADPSSKTPKPSKDTDKAQKKTEKPQQQTTYPQRGQYPTQTTRRQSWQTTRVPQSWETTRAPQSWQTTRAPQSGQTTRAPQSWQTTRVPQSWQTTRAPQSGQTTRAPQSWQTTRAPQSGQTTRAPQSWQTTRAAQSWQTTRASQSGQTTRAPQSWQTTRAPQSWQTPRQPVGKQPQTGISRTPPESDNNSFQNYPPTDSRQTQAGSYPHGPQSEINPSQPQSGRYPIPQQPGTGTDVQPQTRPELQPQTGAHPSRPHSGSHTSQPQSGRYPSQPQSGRYPSPQQPGSRYPSQPQSGTHTSQPPSDPYQTQPETVLNPSLPQGGAYPPQQETSYPSSAGSPQTGLNPSQSPIPGTRPSQPHSGAYPSNQPGVPQTGSHPSHPPSGSYPSQQPGSPQSGSYPTQPQSGSYPSHQPGSPQSGTHSSRQPGRPVSGSYPSQPQSGIYPSQPGSPQSGSYPTQQQPGTDPSQQQPDTPSPLQPTSGHGQSPPGRPTPGYPQRQPGSPQTQPRFTTRSPQSQPHGVPQPTTRQPFTPQARPVSGQRQPTGSFVPAPAPPRRPTTTTRVPISVTGTSSTPGEDSRRTLYEIVEDPALLIRGRPVHLTKIFALFHKAGIEDILTGPGPTTVFLPSDDAFALLPQGVIEQLEENPELLRQILLYHVTQSEILPSAQPESYTVPSLEGNQLVLTMLNGGKLIFVSGAKAVAVTRANNGIFYVINQLLYPLPQHDIVGAIQSRPDLSTLAFLLPLSGLEEMLRGQTPYTLLAPTDNAFAQLPQSVYDELTRNTTALQEILLNHIIEGAHYGREFFMGGTFPSARGGKLKFQVVSYGYQVNDVNIKTPEIVTGSGVIHLIDQVLLEDPDLQFITNLENSLTGDDGSLTNSQQPDVGGQQPSRDQLNPGGRRPVSGQVPGVNQPRVGGLQPSTGQPAPVGRMPVHGQGVTGSQRNPGQRQPGVGSVSQQTPGQSTDPNTFTGRQPLTQGVRQPIHAQYQPSRQPQTQPGQQPHSQQGHIQPGQQSHGQRGPSQPGQQPHGKPGQQPHGQQGPNQLGQPGGSQSTSTHGQRPQTTAFGRPATHPGSQGALQTGGQPNDVADLARSMGLNQFANWVTNTGLLEKIHDGGVYTVFAPTDDAVSSLPQDIVYSIDSNPDQVKPILEYHIVPQRLNLNSITNEETASTLLKGKTIRFNVYQNSQPDCKQLMTASGTPVGEALATMGSIQVIPVTQVLYQPSGNLQKIVEASPILQKLNEAVKAARVTWILAGTGPMTIFAPSDTAFDSLTEDERKSLIDDKQAFSELLKRHIVRGTFFSSGIQEDVEKRSENNKPIALSLQEGILTVNSVPVTYSDITATNGVLHVIDHFL